MWGRVGVQLQDRVSEEKQIQWRLHDGLQRPERRLSFNVPDALKMWNKMCIDYCQVHCNTTETQQCLLDPQLQVSIML